MNKRPLFLAAAFFLLGILSVRLWNVWIFLLSAIFLACHSYLRWKKRGSVQGIVYAVTFSVIFVLGICHMQNAIKSHQAVGSLLEDGEKAAVWGTVSKKEEGAKSTKIYLKHCYLRVEEKQLPCRQILVYLNTDVSVGNIIYVNGTVKTLEPARNEGNFDEKNFYESQGTDFKFYGENVQFISRDTDRFAEFLYQKKREVIQLYQKTMGAETAGVLSTMVLGDRQLLEPEIKSLYQKTGISHILAISGLHVSIIGMGFYKMLQKQRVPLLLRSTLSAVAILVFAVLSGAGVSTKRAVLMFLLLLFGGVIGRSYDSLTGLALAAIFLLWENPFVYAYTGFILSFLAVLGVDASVILLKSMDIQKGIREQICVSGCIQAFTIPVIAYCYFELPIYVIFINLLILPTTGVVLFLGIFGGLLGLLYPVLGFLPLQGAKGMLMLYQSLCRLFLKLPGAVWTTGKPRLQRLIFYYVVLAAILTWLWYGKKPQRKLKTELNNRLENHRLKRIALTLFYLELLTFSMQKEGKRFQIQVLDVGQGDGIYIESDAGTEIFVDGGSVDVSEVGKYRIQPFLKSHGVKEVDYWFVSHCDADHCNGLMELLEADVPIKHLVFSKYVLRDEAQEELVALAKRKGCQVLYLEEGECFRDASVRIQAMYPSEKSVEGERNADSLVLLLEHEAFRGLLTGDIGQEQEKKFIEAYGNMKIDWYKAAHHGSKTSNSKEFLEVLQPKLATISCGRNNSYGHPGKEAVEHMQDVGAEIFQTTECGQISITQEDGKVCVRRLLKEKGVLGETDEKK